MTETLDKPISIRFESAVVEHLRRVARYEAFERDQDITVADLIRESVLQVYPMPKDANEDANEDHRA
jgi:hypothetical protein